jgi:hypothetical protein
MNRQNRKYTYTEFDLGREELELLSELLGQGRGTGGVCLQADKAGCDDAFLALEGTENLACKLSTRECHRQRRGASALLRLDNLVTAELDALDQGLVVGGGDTSGKGVRRLRKERDDL